MAEPSTSGAPSVLIVEDDRAVRDLLATLFAAEGLVVHTARDGLEGLLKAQVHHPTAIVLDIMMPDVGGLRVLDQLADEHADIPVIVVTGKPEAAEEARARLGPANVFSKPFEIDDVLARIRALVWRP